MKNSPALLVSLAAGLWPSAAAAQQLNAQRFQPSIDGREFMVTDDSQVGASGVGGGLTFNYADDPFIYRYNDADRSELDVLASVATTNLVAFANMSRFRVGVDVPLHVASSGFGVEGFRLFGDIGLDGKYMLLDRDESPVGLGFSGRVALPTGNGDAWLGDKSPSFTLATNATMGNSHVLGAVNLGIRAYTGSAAQIDDVKWGNRLLFKGGVSVPILDPVWASAEISGERLFGSGGSPGSTPIEGLLSLRGNPTGDLIASLGMGAGLTQGIGAPDYRVVAGVSWVPGKGQTATDAYVDTPVSAGDRDGDGVADYRDLCPDQAEDYNGQADDDGCPDGGLTPTRIWVRDAQGAQVAGATIELLSGPETGRWAMPDGEMMRSMSAGHYRVSAEAQGFHDRTVDVDVPEAPRHEAVISLDPVIPTGDLTISVTDVDGAPVQATLRLLGANGQIDTAADGVGRGEIPAGTWEVVVGAPGHASARRTITVEPNGTASMDVVLPGARVKVTEDHIVILDRVFFEFDSAVIKPESFAILDEVSAALREHGEILSVEIQGHTDDQGPAEYNRKLSQQRSEAVLQYLARSGVQSARLLARGYGEDRPLQSGETDDVRATNRRVEFVILRRAAPAEGSNR